MTAQLCAAVEISLHNPIRSSVFILPPLNLAGGAKNKPSSSLSQLSPPITLSVQVLRARIAAS